MSFLVKFSERAGHRLAMLNRKTSIRQLPICIFLVAVGGVAGAGCLASVTVGTTDLGTGGAGTGTTSATVTVGATTVSSTFATTGLGQSSTTAGVTTGGPPTPATALALTTDELPSGAQPCGGNPCTPPVDMLFIEMNTAAITCQDPVIDVMSGGNDWRRQIGLPAQYQVVGTYSMSDPAIYYAGWVAEFDNGSGTAVTVGVPGGGTGTIEVLSVDNNQIKVRLLGTSLGVPDTDGDFTAVRCTPLPNP